MRAIVIPEPTGPAAASLQDISEPVGAHERSDGRRILVNVRVTVSPACR
jgi:NADPH:quinone reductase